MSRSRNSLHLSKLEEFAAFCVNDGWVRQQPKGYDEVLRMTKTGKEPLIVHKQAGAKEHATTWGNSQMMFVNWIKSKRAETGSLTDAARGRW